MNRIFGLTVAGGVVLGLASSATAQTNSLNAFGGYPAGITTGSQYGFYPGGYNGAYSSGNSVYRIAPPVGTSTYYSSGFYGGVPGTTTYGPGVNYSATTAYPNGTYGYSSSYRAVPSYSYPVRQGGPLRRMWGGRR